MIDRYTVGSVSLENLDLCTWVSFSLELRWGTPRRIERSQVSIASPLSLEWRVGSKSSVPWPSPQAGKEDCLGEQETCPLPIAFKWKGKMAFPANRAIFLDFSQDLWPAYSLYSHCIALQTIGLIHSFHEQPLYLTPHSPKAQLSDLAHNSASWLLSYWIKGFFLQDLSTMPTVTCALLLSGAGSTTTCRESSACKISQHWFSMFHKSVFWTRWTSFQSIVSAASLSS